jgi:hypothetical protein
MRISMMSGCCGYQIVQPQRMWGLRPVVPGVAGGLVCWFSLTTCAICCVTEDIYGDYALATTQVGIWCLHVILTTERVVCVTCSSLLGVDLGSQA